MAERRKREDKTSARRRLDVDKERERLRIDKDDLDQGLLEQPEAYYRVSQAYVEAVARRDAKKLDIEVRHAELSQKIRDRAERDEEKLTETAVKERISADEDMQDMRREYLQLCSEVDEWGALRDAFQQRSYMLREMVGLYISRLRELSLESGQGSRAALDAERSNHVTRTRRQRMKD